DSLPPPDRTPLRPGRSSPPTSPCPSWASSSPCACSSPSPRSVTSFPQRFPLPTGERGRVRGPAPPVCDDPSPRPSPRSGEGDASAHADVFHDSATAPPAPRPHDVEVAAGVPPDAVTRAKARVAPPGQALAVEGEHADHAAIVLRDVHDIVGVHVE